MARKKSAISLTLPGLFPLLCSIGTGMVSRIEVKHCRIKMIMDDLPIMTELPGFGSVIRIPKFLPLQPVFRESVKNKMHF